MRQRRHQTTGDCRIQHLEQRVPPWAETAVDPDTERPKFLYGSRIEHARPYRLPGHLVPEP
jgi:hypothetical protein